MGAKAVPRSSETKGVTMSSFDAVQASNVSQCKDNVRMVFNTPAEAVAFASELLSRVNSELVHKEDRPVFSPVLFCTLEKTE
jgi:hypothetical protein